MTYLLDTMAVSYFLQARQEGALASASLICPMAVVEHVHRELKADPSRGGGPFEKWFRTSKIKVRSIEVGSEAFGTLTHLSNPACTSKNLGERASIALAASDASLTFVTNDKRGTMIALRELWRPGERILGICVFLRRLVEAGAVQDPKVLDDVIFHAQTPGPTWWPLFRANLASP